ncbi:hypothetical protein [Paenibacillus camelliae]|uniref:hypothetical protein n=1 Tax=Paenibacillus camelliae TaxID=512410 RepID=UPI00203F0795|nr:hypothetical protein [Paenibacillus camelliae]MCM3632629.1 hypothetical protein [Paenibacillus camelliae]
MKRISIFLSTMVLFLSILLISCENTTKYQELTNTQYSEILNKEQIIILGTKVIYKEKIPITIISYKTKNEIGNIEAYNENGELNYRKALITDLKNDKPIKVLGSNAKYKYASITFLDKQMQQNTTKLLISYNNKEMLVDYNAPKEDSIIVEIDNILETNALPSAVELNIDFIDKNNNVIFRYPSNQQIELTLNYYDYVFSSMALELLRKSEYKKISIDQTPQAFDSMYDLWLHTLTIDLTDEQRDVVIDSLDKLHSNDGHFFTNLREKQESITSNNKLSLHKYLLDTKMGIEIYKTLEKEIPESDKLWSYLEKVIEDIDGANLDFVSKGSILTQIYLISEKIDKDTVVKGLVSKQLNDLNKLYSDANPSIDTYITAIELNELYENVVMMNKEEVYNFLESVQTTEGMFNIDGYKSGYDSLATYLAIRILTSLELPVPNEVQLVKMLEKIHNDSYVRYQ